MLLITYIGLAIRISGWLACNHLDGERTDATVPLKSQLQRASTNSDQGYMWRLGDSSSSCLREHFKAKPTVSSVNGN